MKKVFLTLLFTVLISSSSYAGLGCSASPASFMKIFSESVATLYNVFPIEIAGVPIRLMHLPDADEIGGLPVCMCMLGTPPIPHIGLTFGWWNPQATIETTKAPFCFPSLGFGFGSLGGKFFGEGKSQHGQEGAAGAPRKPNMTFLNLHYIKYPTFIVLGILSDVACLNATESGIDLFYLSEVDPTWRDDELAAILNPESIVFANPLAQAACMADAATSTAGFPLNPLFWCMGSWGSSYPLAGNIEGKMKERSAGLAARGIYRMCRMGMLWQTIGRASMCQPIPMPIWIKSQYSIFEAYPRLWPKRMPIGRSGILWTMGANPPIPKKDDNFVYFLYQHHHCCLF